MLVSSLVKKETARPLPDLPHLLREGGPFSIQVLIRTIRASSLSKKNALANLGGASPKSEVSD